MKPTEALSPEEGMVEQDLREAIARIVWDTFCGRHGGPFEPTAPTVANEVVFGTADTILQLPAISLASRDLKPAASGAVEEQPPFQLYDRVRSDGQIGDAAASVMAMQRLDQGWMVWIHRAAYGSNHLVWAHELHLVSHAPSTPPQVEREGSRDDLEALDLDAMEKVARAAETAVPGEWIEVHEPVGDEGDGVTEFARITGYEPTGEFHSAAGRLVRLSAPEISAHIATFDPPTALRLIATNREMDGERERAELDAHELTKALTGLTCGGSEFFVRKRGRYLADIDACLSYIRRASEGRNAVLKGAIQAKQSATCRAEAAEASNRECDEALKLAEGRLAMLLPAVLDGSDHPTATHYVLNRVRTAISHALSKSEGA